MPASAAALPISPGDQAVLRRWANAAQAPAALVQRAKLLLLAAELGISHSTVARVWAEHDLKPWQTETFKFSTEAVAQARMVWLRGGQVANALGSFGR